MFNKKEASRKIIKASLNDNKMKYKFKNRLMMIWNKIWILCSKIFKFKEFRIK